MYQIQLYTAHDLDLITFKNVYMVNTSKAIYCALKAFTRGEVFVIKPPEKRESYSAHRRKYRCTLRLDVDKDKEEIELLSKVSRGYRNNFLKNLLRLYIRTPLTELFLNNKEDYLFFLDKFNVFKKGLRQADIASIKKEQNQQMKIGLTISSTLTNDLPEAETKAATKKAQEIVKTIETVSLPSGQLASPNPQAEASEAVPSAVTPMPSTTSVPASQTELQIVEQTNKVSPMEEETPMLAQVIMPEDVANLEVLTEELSNAGTIDDIFNDLD